jgi:hypothetical protein
MFILTYGVQRLTFFSFLGWNSVSLIVDRVSQSSQTLLSV